MKTAILIFTFTLAFKITGAVAALAVVA